MSTAQPAVPSGSTPKPATPKSNKPQKPKEDKPQKGKEDKQQKPKDASAPKVPAADGEANLTPKQLKELKKAEKQARRASDKATAGVPSGGKPDAGVGDRKGKPQQAGAKGAQAEKKGGKAERTDRGSGSSAAVSAGQPAADQGPKKEIALFRHLENPERKVHIAGAHKDVHPAILALGLQMASFDICGSSARCVATLQAFKRASDPGPPD